MTILVDMDDVLEDFIEGFVDFVNKRHGTSVTPEDIREWDMTKAFKTIPKEKLYSAEFEEDIWNNVKPKKGAPETLKKLIDEGHRVYVVTATYYQSLRAKMDNVLFRYFPYLKWEDVIITFNKQMIKGDVLIDDGPHNLIGGDYKKILFDSYHNKNFDESSIGAVRAYDWDDIYRLIKEMSE